MAGNEVEKKAEELLEAIGVELAKSREKYADDILSGKEIPLYTEKAVCSKKNEDDYDFSCCADHDDGAIRHISYRGKRTDI